MKGIGNKDQSVLAQIADLSNLSHDELKDLWQTLYGRETPAYSRPYLIKRLAYRIQEIAYGGLSESTQTKLKKALKKSGYDENAGVRIDKRSLRKRSNNLPVIGTRLIREWNDGRYEVIVVDGGYEYQGKKYRSLTRVANIITGTHRNGLAFFGISKVRAKRKETSQ